MSTKTKKRKIKSPGVYHDSNGKYYLKYKNKTYRGFDTVEAAELFKATLRLSKDTISTSYFKTVIEDFLMDQQSRVDAEEITYGTFDKKRKVLQKYVTDEIGGYTISNLSPAVLRGYRNSLIGISISSKVKNYILQQVKAVLDHAQKYHDLKDDLTIYLDPFPKTTSEKINEKNKLPYIWTDDDFDRFTADMQANYSFVFTMMFRHGLRVGEVQAIRYSDVNFELGKIDINGSITRKNSTGRQERKETKTVSSSRVINIGKSINLIKHLYESNKSTYSFNDNWYVCNNKIPLSDKQIQIKRLKHIKMSGLATCTNHDFRHMFVTNAWSAGVPITAISKYVGHKNISITLSTYSHLTNKDNDKMDDYINNL